MGGASFVRGGWAGESNKSGVLFGYGEGLGRHRLGSRCPSRFFEVNHVHFFTIGNQAQYGGRRLFVPNA